jgi:hypothetical protein
MKSGLQIFETHNLHPLNQLELQAILSLPSISCLPACCSSFGIKKKKRMDVIVLEYWCRECWLREGEISCSSSPLNRTTRCSYIGKNGEETRKK